MRANYFHLLLSCAALCMMAIIFSVPANAETQAEKANLPIVTLTIDESRGTISAMNADPEHDTKCYGTFSLTLPDGYQSEYGRSEGYEGTMSIRGRGSSSWGWPKKPYQVNLDSKADLLGMGAAKKWTLIANYADRTLMRNKLLYDLADAFGLPYSAKSVFVEVVMNGEYLGNYILCEKVEVGTNRVDIGDDGFLIEKNGDAASFRSSLNYAYEINNPDPPTLEETAAIRDYYNSFEQAVFADGFYNAQGQYYDDLADFDTLVNYFILTELSKEVDVMHKSVYFYKSREEGSKLFIGPVWDFDRSLGNSAVNNCNVPDGFYAADRYLWSGICRDRKFMDAVVKRYEEVYPLIQELYQTGGTIDTYSAILRKSANFEKWDIMESPGSAITPSQGSYENEIAYMKTFLKTRAEWLRANLRTLQEKAVDRGEVVVPKPDAELSGSGTKSDPYLIRNSADFAAFTSKMLAGNAFAGKYLRQTASVDMTTVIGYSGAGGSASFSGYYDGGGHTIHVSLSGSDQCVFPYVSGTIINLGVTGKITNTSHTGALARSLRVDSKIINCYTDVDASTTSGTLGGIAASCATGECWLVNCYSAGTLNGVSGRTGALLGNPREGIIVDNCYYSNRLPTGSELNGGTALSDSQMRTLLADYLNRRHSALSGLYGFEQVDLCRFTGTGSSYPVLEPRGTGSKLAGRILSFASGQDRIAPEEIAYYDYNHSGSISAVDALIALMN